MSETERIVRRLAVLAKIRRRYRRRELSRMPPGWWKR